MRCGGTGILRVSTLANPPCAWAAVSGWNSLDASAAAPWGAAAAAAEISSASMRAWALRAEGVVLYLKTGNVMRTCIERKGSEGEYGSFARRKAELPDAVARETGMGCQMKDREDEELVEVARQKQTS